MARREDLIRSGAWDRINDKPCEPVRLYKPRFCQDRHCWCVFIEDYLTAEFYSRCSSEHEAVDFCERMNRQDENKNNASS